MANGGSTARTGWIILACLIGVPFLIAYAAGSSSGPLHTAWRKATFMFPSNATGTITSSGAGGNWTMHLNSCQSGERRDYWGVTFFDEDQPKTGGRLVLPESGPPHVLVNIPDGEGSMEYDQDECTVWDADLQHTSSKVNGIWSIKGHARFDCRGTAPVTRLMGDVTFRSCH